MGVAGAGSTAVDLEAKRLEVMKRRQERELEQMLSFELARKSLQVRRKLLTGRAFNGSRLLADRLQ